MMGVAAWLVWKGPVPEVRLGPQAKDVGRSAGAVRLALILFGVQLVLNALWTWLFFGWGRLLFASIEIAMLLLVAGVTTWAFGRVRSGAAWLMVPYLVWLVFATALSFTLWRLNP
jgi:tryptophan-rich sensory protein